MEISWWWLLARMILKEAFTHSRRTCPSAAPAVMAARCLRAQGWGVFAQQSPRGAVVGEEECAFLAFLFCFPGGVGGTLQVTGGWGKGAGCLIRQGLSCTVMLNLAWFSVWDLLPGQLDWHFLTECGRVALLREAPAPFSVQACLCPPC